MRLLCLAALWLSQPVGAVRIDCVGQLANGQLPQVLVHFLPFPIEYSPQLSAILAQTELAGVLAFHEPVLSYGFASLPNWERFHPLHSTTPVQLREVVLVYNRTERRAVAEIALLGLPAPKAGVIDETERSFLERERPTAELLCSEGRHVISKMEEVGTRNAEACLKTIDSQIVECGLGEQVQYATVPIVLLSTVEFKRTDRGRSGTLLELVAKSLKRGGQSPNIILDARDTELTPEESERTIKRVIGYLQTHWDRGYPDRLRELRIVGPDFDHLYVLVVEDELSELNPPMVPGVQKFYGSQNQARALEVPRPGGEQER